MGSTRPFLRRSALAVAPVSSLSAHRSRRRRPPPPTPRTRRRFRARRCRRRRSTASSGRRPCRTASTTSAASSRSRSPPGPRPGGRVTVAVEPVRLRRLDRGRASPVSTRPRTAQVRAIAASPDGSRIYIAGDFTTVNGQTRNRIAALDAERRPARRLRAERERLRVRARVRGSTVYLGGSFTSVDGTTRARAAAVTTSGAGSCRGPAVGDDVVRAIAVSPDGTKVLLGGSFSTVNGVVGSYGMGAVNADHRHAGEVGREQHPPGLGGQLRGAQPHEPREHRLRDDVLVHQRRPRRDRQLRGRSRDELDRRLHRLGRRLPWRHVLGSRVRRCALHGGSCPRLRTDRRLPAARPAELPPRDRVLAQRGLCTPFSEPGNNFNGKPAPNILDWYPDLNAGTYTGLSQGPWSVSAGSGFLVYGGEFTKVDGAKQQGLVRFQGTADSADPSPRRRLTRRRHRRRLRRTRRPRLRPRRSRTA